jgi:hypothetical protein
MKSSVFLYIMLCSLLKVNWPVGGTCCLHFQSQRISPPRNHHAPGSKQNSALIFNGLNGIISQKTERIKVFPLSKLLGSEFLAFWIHMHSIELCALFCQDIIYIRYERTKYYSVVIGVLSCGGGLEYLHRSPASHKCNDRTWMSLVKCTQH